MRTDSSYEDLLERYAMPTWEVLMIRMLAIEVYKAIYCLLPMYIQELFKVNDIPYDLMDPSRINVSKATSTRYVIKSLTYAGRQVWNKITINI